MIEPAALNSFGYVFLWKKLLKMICLVGIRGVLAQRKSVSQKLKLKCSIFSTGQYHNNRWYPALIEAGP